MGGAVRDWLLGLPVTDIDIAAQGDGIEFARALLARHGGKLTTHEAFHTATWHTADGLEIDVTTARTERYAHPAALPQVAPSTLTADFSRRDFTVNALALQLGKQWLTHDRDALLDPHGGLADLRQKTLRAFHAQSFVDDPTRIFRAARYAARFDFELEPDTREWLRRGLPHVRQLSGERARYDLELILEEREPEKALALLAGWDVFRAAGIPIPETEKLAARFGRARAALPAHAWLAQADVNRTGAGWAALMYHAGQLAARRWLEWIPFDAATRDALLDLGPISALSASLFGADHAPSQRHRLLESFTGRGLALAWLYEQNADKRRDFEYELREWRAIRPSASGEDLKARGLPPGPRYKQILTALQDALIDKQITTNEEERELLDKLTGDIS